MRCTSRARARAPQSRSEGPYLPSNVDFVAANNGLPEGAAAVRRMLMAASYMVMGLGDVYLGAPCAVPVDPRCRLGPHASGVQAGQGTQVLGLRPLNDQHGVRCRV